jgi:hypothetical protein
MATTTSFNSPLADTRYEILETANGIWRRYAYPNGRSFAEFKTHLNLGGLPLLHYTHGICPETNKRIIAHGVIAVGRTASGVIAIGQLAMGLIAIGQLSIGIVLAFGQAALGTICFGQLSVGLMFAVGQFAAGQIAIGQFALGGTVLAQLGFGKHVIDMNGVDPVAKNFFLNLIGQ